MTEIADFFGDDQPFTLREACARLFDDAIGPATLMAEHRRGNLRLEKIGRRYLVTPAAIKEMRRKCQVVHVAEAPAYGYNRSAPTPMAASNDHDGLSGTDRSSAALDALQMTLQLLKKH